MIDKDRTSAVLAHEIGAHLLLIPTGVDRVYLDHVSGDPKPLGAVTLAECEAYIGAWHFPEGSMGPKVEAIHEFLLKGGSRGLITSPDKLEAALAGQAGTHFIGRT